MLEGVPALEGSAGRVRWKGFQRWKGVSSTVPASGSSAERGCSRGSGRGFQQVSYQPFHLHFVLFRPQLVQRHESVAEPQARGDNAVSAVDSVLVAWQARKVVTWPTSAAAERGAVAELMFQSSKTTWYNVLEDKDKVTDKTTRASQSSQSQSQQSEQSQTRWHSGARTP